MAALASLTDDRDRDDARVYYTPDVWTVPATLADFECSHGKIGACDECDGRAA